MPTKTELSQDKRLINVSNLVQYTSDLKDYLDASLSKKQDVLENGKNIAVLIINTTGFSLIGNSSSTIDLTDSIAKTITRNFLKISNKYNATDFTNATINFTDISNAFKNGIEQYIGISWKKYNITLQEYIPVYLYFVGVEKDAQWSKFHFISFDGIYTITISNTSTSTGNITRKSF